METAHHWHSRDLGIVVSLLLDPWGKVVLLVLLPCPGSKLAQWKSSFHYPVFSCVQMRVTEKPEEHSERLKHYRLFSVYFVQRKNEGKEKQRRSESETDVSRFAK